MMKEIKSQSNLEYQCLKGLSENGKKYAKDHIKIYMESEWDIPFGMIRKAALKIK